MKNFTIVSNDKTIVCKVNINEELNVSFDCIFKNEFNNKYVSKFYGYECTSRGFKFTKKYESENKLLSLIANDFMSIINRLNRHEKLMCELSADNWFDEIYEFTYIFENIKIITNGCDAYSSKISLPSNKFNKTLFKNHINQKWIYTNYDEKGFEKKDDEVSFYVSLVEKKDKVNVISIDDAYEKLKTLVKMFD